MDLRERLKKPFGARSTASTEGRHKVEVIVELPRSARKNRLKFRVPSDTTIEEFTNQLAKHLNVADGRWKLYGSQNEGQESGILKDDTPINNYSLNHSRHARLYFYPELRL